ncbi:MAG TPA: STAS domain-containing protein [Acidimicrobiales bacterium]
MELTSLLRAEVLPARGGFRIRLRGELDLLSRHRLIDLLARLRGPTLVVDLTDLSFIDASGVGALIMAWRQARASGDQLVARGATGMVRRVFELLDLLDVFGLGPADDTRGRSAEVIGARAARAACPNGVLAKAGAARGD